MLFQSVQNNVTSFNTILRLTPLHPTPPSNITTLSTPHHPSLPPYHHNSTQLHHPFNTIPPNPPHFRHHSIKHNHPFNTTPIHPTLPPFHHHFTQHCSIQRMHSKYLAYCQMTTQSTLSRSMSTLPWSAICLRSRHSSSRWLPCRCVFVMAECRCSRRCACRWDSLRGPR